MKKKIAIVDDHEFFRGGLKLALKKIKEVELVFEAQNGKELLELLKKNQVDLIFLDIRMPVMDGYSTALEVKKLFSHIKILILTMFDNDEYIQNFLEAGVDGFILKNINKDELQLALERVFNDQQYFSNELMPFFTRQVIQKTKGIKEQEQITNRELEILQLIFDGFSNKEIAEKLFISIRTVTNHRANLNFKTGSKNTASLISYALKHNLVK